MVLAAQPNGGRALAKGANMPSNTAAAPAATASQHVYVAHAAKVAATAKGAHTMPQWAAMVCASMGQPASAANVKRVGRYLRGYAWRATGNGCGKGNTYPPTTGAQLAQGLRNGNPLAVPNATPAQYTAAQAANRKVLAAATAQARKVATAQAAKPTTAA